MRTIGRGHGDRRRRDSPATPTPLREAIPATVCRLLVPDRAGHRGNCHDSIQPGAMCPRREMTGRLSRCSLRPGPVMTELDGGIGRHR
jgi:hypothetical protein